MVCAYPYRKRKLTAQIVAMNIRLACLLVLVPILFENYSAAGIRFQASGQFKDGCDVNAPDVKNVAGLYAANIWLITLLVWEMGYVPGLQWDE